MNAENWIIHGYRSPGIRHKMAHFNTLQLSSTLLFLFFSFLFFFFFCLFAISRAASMAYGGSQARGLIGAVAAGLHHSSHQGQILNPLSEAMDQTRNLMLPSRIR